MMGVQLLWRAFCLSVLMISPLQGQTTDCSMLEDSQLGNTSALSTEGLLAAALRAQSGDDNVSLQILEANTVCLGQGTVRDAYHSVSVVVRYREVNDTEQLVQVEYQCTNGEWGFGNESSVSTIPEGNVTTALRRDCSLCIEHDLSPDGGMQVSAEEHCLPCPSSCTGQMTCGGLPDAACCNHFDMAGFCVSSCPTNSQPNNESSICECDQGYTPTDLVGRNCTNVNECLSNPCENEGTCVDVEGEFSCVCLEHWNGTLCETCTLLGCANCSAQPDQNRTVCTDCDEGFSLSDDETCECDIDGCLVCSTNGTCDRCDSNYMLTVDSLCEPEETITPTEDTEFSIALIIGVAMGLVVLLLVICVVLSVGIACTCPCECGKRRQW